MKKPKNQADSERSRFASLARSRENSLWQPTAVAKIADLDAGQRRAPATEKISGNERHAARLAHSASTLVVVGLRFVVGDRDGIGT
ncbi:MAG TPA: hypothetical protein VGO04_19390 [Ensifer sp.]|jgi:hypothetical protein|uniref:hypothetical protein n=1 Tax=Ensifer sp. TaxID=1872086 RepID=UPI002E0FBE29|nr:hypothetical protein [Ensifer sp.]